MNHDPESPISPTLGKVLSEFLEVMKADESIKDAGADRLDALLRRGKPPKLDEISVALFSAHEDDADGEGG